MGAPTLRVLDSFNAGASQALSARSGWGSGHWQVGDADWTTDAAPTYASNNNVLASNMWATPFSTNHEATTLHGPTIDSLLLITRGDSATAAALTTGYLARIGFSGAMSLELLSTSTLASGTFAAPLAGDAFAFQAFGNRLGLYRYLAAGGGWTCLLSVVDTTYPNGRYIGIAGTVGNAPKFDSFGGGDIIENLASPSYATFQQTAGAR